MKKFIISEDERSRILSMHESATKRQYLSEQGEPQPGGNVNKGVELNNSYVKQDVNGKILGQNPKFVELANKNNINLRNLKFSDIGNKSYVMWVPNGTNEYKYFAWKEYNGQNYAGAKQKEQDAFKKVFEYWKGLKDSNNQNLRKCVESSTPRLSKIAQTDQFCKAVKVYEGWKKIEDETKYKYLKYLASIQDFVELGPKWKTA